MLIHVFDDTPHHYIGMSAFFLDECDIQVPQQFWVRHPKKEESQIDEEKYYYYQNNIALIKELKQLPSTARVIFHGLFEPQIWRRLLWFPIVKQCSCIFWGTDIYRYSMTNRPFKSYISQFLHAMAIFRMQSIVSLNKGDGELITKYLLRENTKVLPYPLIGYQAQQATIKQSTTLKILVGNSAAKSNEHRWALEQLVHLAEDDIEIIMPLNYAGTPDYVSEIITLGRSIFGEKFKPITDMLDKQSYNQLLADVDVTLFAQNRQQGLYVVYAMLQMGKPVFLKQATSSFRNLTSLGFELGATENFAKLSYAQLTELSNIANIDNQSLMNKSFSEQALAPQWSKFLNSLVV